MKYLFTHEGPAPFANWTRVRTRHPVQIPKPGGEGFSETVEAEIDAWKNEEGEIFVPGEVKEKLEDLKARLMGLLSPKQMKELRSRLDLTQKAISELLQIGEKTWTRWETGKERPSRSMNLLLQAFYDGRVDAAYLRTMGDPALRQQPVEAHREGQVRRTFAFHRESQAVDEPIVKVG